MEKEFADIEAQKITVKRAEERVGFCYTEAVRMRDEADKLIANAEQMLRAERRKLVEFERCINAIKIASSFQNEAKLLLVDPTDVGKKSYATHTTDGNSVRFVVKQIAYPLEIVDAKIIGLQKPRNNERVQSVKGQIHQNSYDGHLIRSTILETDIYEILSHKNVVRYSNMTDSHKSVFPLAVSDITYAYSPYNVLIDKCQGHIYYDYKSPTISYLAVYVGQRTDLKRVKKTKITTFDKDAEENEEVA